MRIVIVTYNSEKTIAACVQAILSLGEGDTIHVGVHVCVIDNNSTDRTRSILSVWSDKVTLIFNNANVGYTKACNQGILSGTEKYVLLLNPDTEMNSRSVGELIEFMEASPKVALAGPKLLYPNGQLQYSCRTFPNPVTFVCRALNFGEKTALIKKHLMTGFDHATTMDVDWILGSCMIIRREAIDEIGLLDEKYPMYYSDIEICRRAWQRGWKVTYVPGIVATHHYQRQSSKRILSNPLAWSHFRSALRFFISTSEGRVNVPCIHSVRAKSERSISTSEEA